MRLASASVFALATLGGAPFQCGSSSESARHEPSPGDALYELAQDFHAKGNDAAARDTLKYLVDHYPSNRHVPAARAELGQAAASAGSATTK